MLPDWHWTSLINNNLTLVFCFLHCSLRKCSCHTNPFLKAITSPNYSLKSTFQQTTQSYSQRLQNWIGRMENLLKDTWKKESEKVCQSELERKIWAKNWMLFKVLIWALANISSKKIQGFLGDFFVIKLGLQRCNIQINGLKGKSGIFKNNYEDNLKHFHLQLFGKLFKLVSLKLPANFLHLRSTL